MGSVAETPPADSPVIAPRPRIVEPAGRSLLLFLGPTLTLALLLWIWSLGYLGGLLGPWGTDLEGHGMYRLREELFQATREPESRARFQTADVCDVAGLAFWQVVFEREYIDSMTRLKLVSSYGPDQKSHEDNIIEAHECSMTAPRAGDLPGLWGRPDTVLITYNSRNWDNSGDGAIRVVWADQERTGRLTREEAFKRYGITPDEWADPAGKLFGKKAPFQYTFE